MSFVGNINLPTREQLAADICPRDEGGYCWLALQGVCAFKPEGCEFANLSERLDAWDAYRERRVAELHRER